MKRTAWIWMAGCIAWTLDGLLNLRVHAIARAQVGFAVAAMFFIAWLFYRSQPKR